MRALFRRLALGAEMIAAAMLAAMFAAFIVQIIFRYLLGLPVGWTHELSVILWIWLVLWGAAFVLRESDEIRFDILYGAVGPRLRRTMIGISAVGVVALYLISLPAVIDYIGFMKVQRSAYLKIRFDWLFSIYILFAIAVVARYLWLFWQAIANQATPGSEGFEERGGT